MKTMILFLSIVYNAYWTFGQICGTPHPTSPAVYSSSANSRTIGNSVYCIDVFFHVVRSTNGTNAFNLPSTDAIVKKLNKFYRLHNIVINNAGFGFIDDSNLLNINSDGFRREIDDRNSNQTFTNKYGKGNVINYFIVKSIMGTLYDGFAKNIPSNSLFIRSDRVLTPTSAHEVGHCLNLYHTFQGTAANTSGCAEAINGSNCDTCGDLVCDTPADNKTGKTNGFNPNMKNIISYYNFEPWRINLDHFTKGQGKRMRMALDNAPILSDITSNRCVSISTVKNVCYSQTKTITLSNLGVFNTVWSSSSNVQIVSSNNSSVTVRAKSSNSMGNGWVKATLSNGTALQEDFDVGIPNLNYRYYLQNMSLPNNSSTSLLENAWNHLRVACSSRCGDLNGGRWQYSATGSSIRNGNNNTLLIRSNLSRGSNVKINYRSCNACGCSGWRYSWFAVIPGGLVPTGTKKGGGVPLPTGF